MATIVTKLFNIVEPTTAYFGQKDAAQCVLIQRIVEDLDMDVTIQIPVYKESLVEVLMPTLRSCATSRDYYQQQTSRRCNIVVCDDGMMAFCKFVLAVVVSLMRLVVVFLAPSHESCPVL